MVGVLGSMGPSSLLDPLWPSNSPSSPFFKFAASEVNPLCVPLSALDSENFFLEEDLLGATGLELERDELDDRGCGRIGGGSTGGVSSFDFLGSFPP